MKNEITNWLAGQKLQIETCICQAAQKFIESRQISKPLSNVLFDLSECEREALALSRGGDLCYDRFTIGASYSMWYLGRRINTALVFGLDLAIEAIEKQQPIEIFDLGAGTGAVQIAIGLCLQAAQELGYYVPKLRMINIDISPFMLDFNRTFLWKSFRSQYSAFSEIEAEFTVNSWTNPNDIQLQTPYLIASYLFDHTENMKDTIKNFQAIVNRNNPEKLVLLTSNQPAKVQVLDGVAMEIAGESYLNEKVSARFIFSGPMTQVADFRQKFNQEYGRTLSTNTPSWDEYSFYARKLTKRSSRLALLFSTRSPEQKIQDLNLYLPPLKIRKEIVLNEQQRKAASLNNRPTIITGPAGCGKSVVITERVKNLCESMHYDQSLRILITTFNKELSSYLGKWLEQILDNRKFEKRGNNFYFAPTDPNSPNIRLMHFDVLPTRIGGIYGDLLFENDHRACIATLIPMVCNSVGVEVDATSYSPILNPSFLYDEYIRVIYGQQYDTPEKYINGTRSGRPFRLKQEELSNNGISKRALIWKIIQAYLVHLESNGKSSIHIRRHKLLKLLQNNPAYQGIFTHVFVDEFQDCTQADFQIFYGLLQNNNQLVIAGDYAQAIHLGRSAEAPREEEAFMGQERMKNREIIRLEGSYRLPFRISECLKDFSLHLKTAGRDLTDIITPYKGAPPGARPILVYGKDVEEMNKKLLWILWHFQIFDLYDAELPRRKKITILEKDFALCNALNERGRDIAETSTILRLKGMEKDCIVWSTRKDIEDPEDVYYYIYTILTRTCSILIIALFDDVPKYVYKTLSKMDRKRLMFWDQSSIDRYNHKVLEYKEIDLFESVYEEN